MDDCGLFIHGLPWETILNELKATSYFSSPSSSILDNAAPTFYNNKLEVIENGLDKSPPYNAIGYLAIGNTKHCSATLISPVWYMFIFICNYLLCHHWCL